MVCRTNDNIEMEFCAMSPSQSAMRGHGRTYLIVLRTSTKKASYKQKCEEANVNSHVMIYSEYCMDYGLQSNYRFIN